jgi:hypothetical protein
VHNLKAETAFFSTVNAVLLSIEILFSCEDFPGELLCLLMNRARARRRARAREGIKPCSVFGWWA